MIIYHKDHRGNVRLSYDKNLAIQEENNYYPFGLKHKGYNYINNITKGNSIAQKYKYNGKEFQDELGLNMTAMDFRLYDPAIGRFNSMDRLSEFAYSISPYRFAYNNPTGLSENGLNGWVNTGTTVFWDPNVNNQMDVDRLYNGQNYNYLLDDTVILDSDGDKRQLNGDGTVTTILDEVVVSSSNKNTSSNSFSIVEGFSIWGSNRYGDLEGQKGHSKYSIEASDIPAIGGSAHSVNGQMSFWKRLFMLCKLGVDVELRVETIQSLNKPTMEVNNTEPVLPPDQSVTTISIPDVTFDVSGSGSKSANLHSKDTTVVKKDSARVTNEAENKQQKRIENFNKKYGTSF